MKGLKYLVILLFIYSVFGFIPALAKNDSVYDLLYQDTKWLMLKSEKKAFEKAKTDWERKEIIERFWQARDPDSSTFVNEFKEYYLERLKIVRKDYPDSNDPRRYIFLLFGQPNSKRIFSNERITIFDSSSIIINTGRGEIWEYRDGRGTFQVIFGTIDLHRLESIRNGYSQNQKADFTGHLTQNKYEILYLGVKRYNDIADFLRDFFCGMLGVKSTWGIINSQKSSILDRAKEFYKNREIKVKEKRRKGKYSNGLLDVSIFIDVFGFWRGEPRINIWCVLNKNSLVSKKDDEYKADISLYWELRDQNNQRVVYYQEDSIKYKLSEKRNYCYNSWGSAPPGQYKFILEIGENLGKKYKKVEVGILVWDRTNPRLEAEIIVGKVFKKRQSWIQEKNFNPFSRGGQFLPLSVLHPYCFQNEYYFKEKDEAIVFFNVSGFKRDVYGNPCLYLSVVFIDKQGKKFAYRFRPIKKTEGGIVEYFLFLKIGDFIKKFKADSGYYKIMLSIFDVIANESGSVVYASRKKPYQMLIVKSGR